MRYRLTVNLDNQTIDRRDLLEEAWLGGRALLDSILLAEVPPTCHPLGRHFLKNESFLLWLREI
jgi:aldehyde:ferredoxin oxidoreductase